MTRHSMNSKGMNAARTILLFTQIYYISLNVLSGDYLEALCTTLFAILFMGRIGELMVKAGETLPFNQSKNKGGSKKRPPRKFPRPANDRLSSKETR